MKAKIIHINISKEFFIFDFYNRNFVKKIKENDIFVFIQSVCEFLKVKNDYLLAFELSLHCLKREVRSVFSEMIFDFKKGKTCSEIFKEHNFPYYVVFFIENGEKNNDLAASFFSLKNFIEWKMEQKSKFVSAMLYPAFTFFVFVCSMFLFSEYIIPSIIEALSVEIELNLFFGIFSFIKGILILLILSFVGSIIIYFFNTDLFEKMLLSTPILKNLFLYQNIYFVSYFISISESNNLSLVESIDAIAKSSVGICKKVLNKTKLKLIKGEKLSNILKKYECLPLELISLLKTGEDSSNMKNSFSLISNLYFSKYKKIIDMLINFIPIILILFTSFFLMFFVIFIFIPIYSLEFLS